MRQDQGFDDFVAGWLDGQKLRLQPATWVGYSGIVRLYLLPAFGDFPVASITSRDLNRLYARLLDGGGARFRDLAPRTVKQVHAVASRIFDTAILQGLMTVNPAWGASPPQPYGGEPRPVFTVWTAAQLREFIRLVEDHPLGTIFHLAATTGLRRGELLGLPWNNVNGESILVTTSLTQSGGRFSLHTPKIRRPRRLTLDGDTQMRLQRHRLWEVLKERASASMASRWNLVFTDDGGDVVRPDRVTYEFKKLLRTSGLPRIRFHDLRHTHATLLLTSGAPMHVVAARLGHSPRTLLTHYAHMLPSADTAAAALFGSLLRGTATVYSGHDQSPWVEARNNFEGEMWQWNKHTPARRAAAASR